MHNRKAVTKVLYHAFVILFGFMMVYPVLWMISGVVHKHIVGCHLGVLRCHLLGNLSPKTGRGKHIGFIHHRKMFTAFHGIFKSDFQDTLNLRTGIHVRIIRLVIVLVFLTEVHATGQFADAKEIGTIHQFRTKGRLMEQTFEGLHGTDVGK